MNFEFLQFYARLMDPIKVTSPYVESFGGVSIPYNAAGTREEWDATPNCSCRLLTKAELLERGLNEAGSQRRNDQINTTSLTGS